MDLLMIQHWAKILLMRFTSSYFTTLIVLASLNLFQGCQSEEEANSPKEDRLEVTSSGADNDVANPVVGEETQETRLLILLEKCAQEAYFSKGEPMTLLQNLLLNYGPITTEQSRKLYEDAEITYQFKALDQSPIDTSIESENAIYRPYELSAQFTRKGREPIFHKEEFQVDTHGNSINGFFYPEQRLAQEVEDLLMSRNSINPPAKLKVIGRLTYRDSDVEMMLENPRSFKAQFTQACPLFSGAITKVSSVEALEDGSIFFKMMGPEVRYRSAEDQRLAPQNTTLEINWNQQSGFLNIQQRSKGGVVDFPLLPPREIASRSFARHTVILNEDKAGIIVIAVPPKSLFAQAGIQGGDRLVKIGNHFVEPGKGKLGDWRMLLEQSAEVTIDRMGSIEVYPLDGEVFPEASWNEMLYMDGGISSYYQNPDGMMNRIISHLEKGDFSTYVQATSDFHFVKNPTFFEMGNTKNAAFRDSTKEKAGRMRVYAIQHLNKKNLLSSSVQPGCQMVVAQNTVNHMRGHRQGSQRITYHVDVTFKSPKYAVFHQGRPIFKARYEVTFDRDLPSGHFTIIHDALNSTKSQFFPEKLQPKLPDQDFVQNLIRKSSDLILITLDEGYFESWYPIHLLINGDHLSQEEDITPLTGTTFLANKKFLKQDAKLTIDDPRITQPLKGSFPLTPFVDDLEMRLVAKQINRMIPHRTNTPEAAYLLGLSLKATGTVQSPKNLASALLSKQQVKDRGFTPSDSVSFYNLVKDVKLSEFKMKPHQGKIYCEFVSSYQSALDPALHDSLLRACQMTHFRENGKNVYKGFRSNGFLPCDLQRHTALAGKYQCVLELDKNRRWGVYSVTPVTENRVKEMNQKVNEIYRGMGGSQYEQSLRAHIDTSHSFETQKAGYLTVSISPAGRILSAPPARDACVSIVRKDGTPVGQRLSGMGDHTTVKGEKLTGAEYLYHLAIIRFIHEEPELFDLVLAGWRASGSGKIMPLTFPELLSSPEAQSQVLIPAEAGGDIEVRLTEFSEKFYLSASLSDERIRKIYAPKVDYFGSSKNLAEIIKDVRSYEGKWPIRKFSLIDGRKPTISKLGEKSYQVKTWFNIELENDERKLLGQRIGLIQLMDEGGEFRITSVSSEASGKDRTFEK
jgi:hypothetical protein